MTLISRTSSALFWAIILSLLVPFMVNAQGSVSLSVSPTLFDMTAEPGKNWPSTIRVINPNPFPLTVYLDVVNFAPQGESGQGKFVPVLTSETNGQTLAEWIYPNLSEITIPAEQTSEIPFSINVPADAAPGGHFAALLVGTKPPEKEAGVTLVETTQIVTSLVFLRVTGDVDESGQVRSFRTTDILLEKPEATFELRFENTGNVHLQPQGEIVIYNMWGQERGTIPINRGTMFGNVLPESTRLYSYTWTGEWSLSDIGRYSAVATLAYGTESRNFASSEIYFWVIPWKIVLIVLVSIFGFASFMVWSIKAYVRRMITLAGIDPRASQTRPISRRQKVKVSVAAPIEDGILDLRQRLSEADSLSERLSHFGSFIRKYWLFFTTLALIVGFCVALIWYISDATVRERSFNVVAEDPSGRGETISSEQLRYEELRQAQKESDVTSTEALPSVRIVNRSGVSGLAADLRIQLEEAGYNVTQLTNELEADEENTVIVYAPELAEAALLLSRDIPDSLLSAYAEATGTDNPITVYVGKDYQSAVQ